MFTISLENILYVTNRLAECRKALYFRLKLLLGGSRHSCSEVLSRFNLFGGGGLVLFSSFGWGDIINYLS